MAGKRYKPEETVSLLRQAKVLHGQGMLRAFRMRNVLDEFTRESVAIRVRRNLSSIHVPSDLFILRGIPGWVRSDIGRSSSPGLSGGGSLQSAPAPPSSSWAHPGRTAKSRASMPGCATSS